MSAHRARPPALRDLPLNLPAIERDAAQLFEAAERLEQYRGFLARARAVKATRSAPNVDRQVYASTRVAAADVARATAAAARLTRAFHHSGVLHRLAAGAGMLVRANGPLRARDTWRERVASESGKAAMRRVGVSDTLIIALDGVMQRIDVEATMEGTSLVVSGTTDGRELRGRMDTAPRPARPRSAVDLLSRGKFEALCDEAERGEPAYLLGPAPAGDLRIEDLLLRDLLATQREGVRHLRKLQDVGLSTHMGGEPGTFVFVGLVILFIGALIMIATCGPDYEETGPEGDCAVGVLLSFLGFVLLLMSGRPPNGTGTSTQSVTGGSAVIHGPLPLLVGTAK